MCRSFSAPSQPPPPAGGLLHPGPQRLDHQHVRQPRQHRLAARTQLLGLGGHESQRLVHPLRVRRAPRLDVQHTGQQRDEVARGGLLEADRAAHHLRGLAARAVPDRLVTPTAHLARDVEEVHGRHARGAGEPVALGGGTGTGAARHQHEIAQLQQACRLAGYIQPAPPRRHHVEEQAAGQGRQPQGPGRREVRAAVEDAFHAQALQRFGQRVGLAPEIGNVHGGTVRRGCPHVQTFWTFEHETRTHRHGSFGVRQRHWFHG